MALRRACVAPSAVLRSFLQPASTSSINSAFRSFSIDAVDSLSLKDKMTRQMANLDINSQVGACMPLASMRIGTFIHNIEMNPGQGGKLVRAAGTCAKIIKEPNSKKLFGETAFWC